MKAAIIQKALDLGFNACRVTAASAPGSARQFQQWLSQGHQGEMHYLERNAHKRIDPGQVLPGAKSILTLAASYTAKPGGDSVEAGTGASPRGIVARYARHADYHDVLAEPLKALTRFITEEGGQDHRSLWYVDTGPLLERDLAQRAGLGFIGKHTNLISRQLGNWFFLSEIITTLELEPDEPETNRCGKCTRCLTACPTEAFVGPFQLDARRCISYLTIELKGSIPEDLRPAIGSRIFGCDDCLEVCPWNRFAQAATLMDPARRADLEEPELCALLVMDEATFRERFRGTPFFRTKRRGLLRNVCVALGNVGTGEALPALERAARDPEPLIAEHAQWAIARIQSRTGVRP